MVYHANNLQCFVIIGTLYNVCILSFCIHAALKSPVHAMNQCAIFEHRFSEATNQCYQELEGKEISFEEVKKVVTDTFYPEDTCKGEGHDITDLFLTDDDVDDIFRTLTRHGIWDFQNYLLLKKIITYFASTSTQLCGVLSKYEDDLTQYQKETMTLDVCNLQDQEVVVNGMFQVLNVKLSRSAEEHCLHQVMDLSKSLASMFSLVPAVMLLKKVTKPPLTIMWFIPMFLCKKMSELIPSNWKWLKEKSIVYMALDGKVLYREKERNVSIS